MNFKSYPRGYRQIAVLDFVRNRRQLLIVNIAALVVRIAMIVGMLFLRPIGVTWEFVKANWWTVPLLAAALFVYIVLHELTHGVLMHLLSGVKPKYGFRLCYAYAGSNVYFDRRSHVLIALAPLVLWGAVLGVLGEVLPPECFWLVWIVQISNVSGAAGDVYCSLIVARMPRDIVIQDTGTRMRILAPGPNAQKIQQGNPI